jgi:hypothetical protein
MKTPLQSLSLVAALAATLASSQAATVIWSPAATISGDSDVNHTGTTIMAYAVTNTGASGLPTTINGVTFANFVVADNTANSVTVGNATLTSSDAPNKLYSINNTFAGTASPFTSLSTGYQTILKNGAYDNWRVAPAIETFTLTLSGLTNGQDYIFQMWVNDSRNYGQVRTETITGGANSVSLRFNTGAADAGVGQFATGSFTASGTTQDFTILGNQSTQINAFQLQSVPEPTTWALLAGGLTVVTIFRRRRQH